MEISPTGQRPRECNAVASVFAEGKHDMDTYSDWRSLAASRERELVLCCLGDEATEEVTTALGRE